MTSMLYTSYMTTKPNDPEECINFKKVSWRTDTKVNYWLFIAVVAGLANEILFHTIVPPIHGQTPLYSRVLAAPGQTTQHLSDSLPALWLLYSGLFHPNPPLQMKNKLRELRAAREW